MHVNVKSTCCPWGKVDHVEIIGEGLIRVSTPSRGGLGLSPARYAALPEPYQIHGTPAHLAHQDWIWFEEDCEAALVQDAFKSEFPGLDHECVLKSIACWFPDQYEKHFGVAIPPVSLSGATPERLNNEQFMMKLMAGELTPHGLHTGFVQVFVIDALTKYADMVAASNPEQYPENMMVNPEAWIATGQAIKTALDTQFSG